MSENTLREHIDWVGYVDWPVRDFHGYDTERGTSYNAYLIRDRQSALIDTVKEPFADRLLENIAALTPLSEVAYVVCNHAEPDHSGALPHVMAAMPQVTLLCNKRCAAALTQHYGTSSWQVKVVAEGETLSLGLHTLQFFDTPMVHWPESMFTYLADEALLFSMDAFGQHYAAAHRFDDESPLPTVLDEAKTYYANIVMPYGKQVAACLQKVAGLKIGMIAPSHGVIWRSHAGEIIARYGDWCVCRPRPKVLVLYDTMWESTQRMAEAIGEGASLPGVGVEVLHVRRTTLARIAGEMLDAAAVAFGSATLNRQMMPMAAAVLNYLQGLRPAGKAGFAFGSYGWGRGGPEAVDEALRAMDVEILREPLRSQYRPTPDVLEACRAAGQLLGERARQVAG